MAARDGGGTGVEMPDIPPKRRRSSAGDRRVKLDAESKVVLAELDAEDMRDFTEMERLSAAARKAVEAAKEAQATHAAAHGVFWDRLMSKYGVPSGMPLAINVAEAKLVIHHDEQSDEKLSLHDMMVKMLRRH